MKEVNKFGKLMGVYLLKLPLITDIYYMAIENLLVSFGGGLSVRVPSLFQFWKLSELVAGTETGEH